VTLPRPPGSTRNKSHCGATIPQVLINNLNAAGSPAGAALVASLVSQHPAARFLLALWHLPQLAYYVLWVGWGSIELLLLAAAALGAAACGRWRLQVRDCAGRRSQQGAARGGLCCCTPGPPRHAGPAMSTPPPRWGLQQPLEPPFAAVRTPAVRLAWPTALPRAGLQRQPPAPCHCPQATGGQHAVVALCWSLPHFWMWVLYAACTGVADGASAHQEYVRSSVWQCPDQAVAGLYAQVGAHAPPPPHTHTTSRGIIEAARPPLHAAWCSWVSAGRTMRRPGMRARLPLPCRCRAACTCCPHKLGRLPCARPQVLIDFSCRWLMLPSLFMGFLMLTPGWQALAAAAHVRP